jgi:hypothetical protein
MDIELYPPAAAPGRPPEPAHFAEEEPQPGREDMLNLLAWALADGGHDRGWWAGRLGLDAAQLDALLEQEQQRLLRARLLRAVGETTGSREVAQALRARVLELAAGQPKGATLAQLALTVKRLPAWIVHEWDPEVPLVPDSWRGLRAGAAGPPVEPDPWDAVPDAAELKEALAEARELLEKLDRDRWRPGG